MIGAVTRLGDRLLERLVPKAAAAACEGASAQAEWFVACWCGDHNSIAPCRWFGYICTTCGGTTHCGSCGSAVSFQNCCG
jgi:hypothetical protein